jgi:hypothetical protein
MRLARMRLHQFRDYAELTVLPPAHTVVAGEPQALSDLVAPLASLASPASQGFP